MIAVIGGAQPASIALHGSCGFTEAGRMKSVGYKFGSWLDSVYMQRSLETIEAPHSNGDWRRKRSVPFSYSPASSDQESWPTPSRYLPTVSRPARSCSC
jgi:hypothetical protein